MNVKGTRFASDQREVMRTEAVRLYTEGLSTNQVAAKVGCSSGTVSNFLAEAGVDPRPRHAPASRAASGSGLLSAAEVAEMLGMGHASFNALRHKGEGPPVAERPKGAHANWKFYRREDVEDWLDRRQQQRDGRKARSAERQQFIEDSRAQATDYAPDWDVLLPEVDKKRAELGLTWEMVCATTGVDKAVMSRLRSGKARGPRWGAFFRLLVWVQGGMPVGVREYVSLAANEPTA